MVSPQLTSLGVYQSRVDIIHIRYVQSHEQYLYWIFLDHDSISLHKHRFFIVHFDIFDPYKGQCLCLHMFPLDSERGLIDHQFNCCEMVLLLLNVYHITHVLVWSFLDVHSKKLHILLILLYYFTPFLGRLHSLWLLVMAVISPLLPRSTSRLKSEHVLHLKSFAVAWRSLGFFLGRSVGEVKKAFWVHFFEIWTNSFFVQKCDFNFLNFPKTFWKHENNIE